MAIDVFREYCTFYATLFIFAGETFGCYFRGGLRSDKTARIAAIRTRSYSENNRVVEKPDASSDQCLLIWGGPAMDLRVNTTTEYLGVHATRLSRSSEGNQTGRVEQEKGRWLRRRRRRRRRGANALLGEERRGWRSKEVSINNARPRLETWKTARLITLLLSLSCLRLYPYARQSGGAPLLLRLSVSPPSVPLFKRT